MKINEMDMTTTLANCAVSFKNKADLCTEAAREALAGMDEPMNKMDPHYSKRARGESARLAAMAGVWLDRSAEAAAGNLLFSRAEVEDISFLNEFADLIKACRDQGRCVGIRAIDRGTGEQTGGGQALINPETIGVRLPKDYGNPGQPGSNR